MLGDIEIKRETLNEDIKKELDKRYIAIDVETTGLKPESDLITDIGLVLYENGKRVKSFETLFKINEELNESIINLTGITNEMLINAPDEKSAYKEVANFLLDALEEKTMLVAHNADFDLNFLKHALERFGYVGVIRYVDTLNISRSLVKGLFNYKQDTVATYFGIVNRRAHRALPDAEVCGEILSNLLKIYDSNDQTLNITTKYDNDFELRVRERGLIYYRFNMINNYKEENNKCSCNITGASTYDVSLEIEEHINGKCNCPYFLDNNKMCKHIYALLLKNLSNK